MTLMAHTKKLNMSLRKTNIIDTNFAHASYSTDFQTSKYISWNRDLKNASNDDIIFMTDNSMTFVDRVNGKKIGMIMEPRAINPFSYDWIEENYSRFDTILTYDNELLKLSDKFSFYPHGGCWIKPEDQVMSEKTKLVSIVASNKTQTDGHKLRHVVINNLKDKIDLNVYGRGYNPIQYKYDTLKDYAFSIVIENSKTDYYFTEKLIDSLITGTVPIYWGCPSIGDFFNIDGFIVFDSIDELNEKVKNLSLEKYNEMLDAVKDNQERAKKYIIAEDWIYENTNIFK